MIINFSGNFSRPFLALLASICFSAAVFAQTGNSLTWAAVQFAQLDLDRLVDFCLRHGTVSGLFPSFILCLHL